VPNSRHCVVSDPLFRDVQAAYLEHEYSGELDGGALTVTAFE
jgi:hypothetical protein